MNYSERWLCGECGGRVTLTNSINTDASAVEFYWCADCGISGRAEYAEGYDPKIVNLQEGSADE